MQKRCNYSRVHVKYWLCKISVFWKGIPKMNLGTNEHGTVWDLGQKKVGMKRLGKSKVRGLGGGSTLPPPPPYSKWCPWCPRLECNIMAKTANKIICGCMCPHIIHLRRCIKMLPVNFWNPKYKENLDLMQNTKVVPCAFQKGNETISSIYGLKFVEGEGWAFLFVGHVLFSSVKQWTRMLCFIQCLKRLVSQFYKSKHKFMWVNFSPC